MTEEVQEVESTEPKSMLDDLGSEVEANPAEMPEGLDEKYWDAENNTYNAQALLDDLEAKDGMVKGLRKKLSRGEQKAPEDINEYTYELPEEVPEGFEIPDDDPLMAAAKAQAKEIGLSKEEFSQFMGPLVSKIAEGFQNQEPPSEAELAEARDAEFAKLGPNGKQIARLNATFINEMTAKGVWTAEDAALIHSSIQNAGQLQAFNKLRLYQGGGKTLKVNDVTGAGETRVELEKQLVEAMGKEDEASYNQISAKLASLG